ncbi:MAG: phosphatase PAP2 family protein [Ignavibacteria bacterium]|nr:phosphatase PAP2 family protein [Ignavibacteria bacterium]
MLRTINNSRSEFGDKIFSFTNDAVIYFAVGVPAAIGLYGLIEDKSYEKNSALFLISTQVLNVITTGALKFLISRERPYFALGDINLLGDTLDKHYSMPSGHASSTFALATALSIRYPNPFIIVTSFLYSSLTAYGRVYSGVHYPSDVLAGALIGSATTFLLNTINWDVNSNEQKSSKRDGYSNISTFYDGKTFGINLNMKF